ncbi:MAG: CRTAC1 family protein [Akkermansiaceae bacterium]|nr:CRTAC1 family protein [Akkermansiaceae bacterium]
MAKSSVSIRSIFLRLAVVAVAVGLAAWLTRHRRAGGGFGTQTAPALLPPLDETPVRPERADAALVARFSGTAMREILASLPEPETAPPSATTEAPRPVGATGDLELIPEFRDLAAEAALDLSGPVAVLDADGDGLLDAVGHDGAGALRFLRLTKQGTFTDSTGLSGLTGYPGAETLLPADFDGDGDDDLFAGRTGERPDSWLRNDGTGVFEEIAEAAGVLAFADTRGGCWTDFDRDGRPDLLVWGKAGPRLYWNAGDGSFRDLAWETGLAALGEVSGADWGDVDGDGFPDLLLTLAREGEAGETVQWRRAVPPASGRAEDFRFSEGPALAGKVEGVATGAGFLDFDRDDRLDVVMWGEAGFRLWRGTGFGMFDEVTAESGLAAVAGARDLEIADLDGDGFDDLLPLSGPARAVLNRGGDGFREIGTTGPMTAKRWRAGWARADFDRDGDLDFLAVAADSGKAALLVRETAEPGAWLAFRLSGAGAAFASVEVVARDRDWVLRRVSGVADPTGRLHFGLGRAETIESLRVTWSSPDGPGETREKLKPNALLKLRPSAEAGDPR